MNFKNAHKILQARVLQHETPKITLPVDQQGLQSLKIKKAQKINVVGLVSRTIFQTTTLFNTENLRIWVILLP